jgi:PadR family transcriptional regulator PadR
MTEIKPTRRTRRVLTALLTGAENIGGSTIWRLTGGSAGGVYVVLDRLECAGWVTSDWEAGKPEGQRRRFYRLTPAGRTAAAEMLRLNL